MDELYVKRLLYADKQVILAPSACKPKEMVKMNDSIKKRAPEIDELVLMNASEATEICTDSTMWKSTVSIYPSGK
ncbi:hypothetical protein EVAR_4653_1 [Eumeta japonica]|uniref:Uncharacterized protein n=1 Tax=Eumeta variegata TaxID=151549 RepID=A0A4C1YDP9_EUMVA|nr:hypothetical protein EVAR_4653_1 [Eumeta japonica]